MKTWTVPFAMLLLAACGSGETGEGSGDEPCGPTNPCEAGFECNLTTQTCLPSGDSGGAPDAGGTDSGPDGGSPDGISDPCEGVACDDPPADLCDGNVAVSFPSIGTCTDGACGYEETRADCSATDQECMNGQCVDPADPCADFACDSPPASTCDGDVVQRNTLPGTCVLDAGGLPTCEYGLETLDCAEFGNQCFDGACVVPDLCRDVDCSTPPADECRTDEVVVAYAAGPCEQGECLWAETLFDCTVDGTIDDVCEAGICIPRPDCFGITCDEAPLSECDGDVLVEYDELGTCFEDTCTYETTRIDCAATGQICQAGACVLPTACDGDLCASPPAPLCRGDVAVSFANPGVCVEGLCQYDEVSDDCAAAGGYCEDGVCEVFEECLELDCSIVPAATCDDITTVLSYVVPDRGPTCRDGECQFDTVLTECDDGLACDEGECVAFDPCTGVVCNRAPFCEGDIAVSNDRDGVCDDGTCDYTAVERRIDCTLTDQACLDGACADPAAFLEPGQLVFTEYYNEGGAEPTSWFELTNATQRALDLTGLEILINDEVVEVPAGTVVRSYGSLVLNNDAFEPDNASGIEYDTVLGTSFTLNARAAGRVIDFLEVNTAWPHEEDVSSQLGIEALGAGNDDFADWCLTDDAYYGTSTPGELPGPCTTPGRTPDLLFTEIMSTADVGGLDGRWVEFFNLGASIDLSGARLVSGANAWTLPPGTVFEEEAYSVLSNNLFAAAGTQLASWDDAIEYAEDEGNLSLFFGTQLLVSLQWDIGEGWPEAGDGNSMQLGVSPFGGEFEDAALWCLATAADVYDADGNLGTPGAANSCTVD